MPVQLSSIVPAQSVPSTGTTLFTTPAGAYARIDSLSVCNVGASAAQVTIYLIPSGGSASGGNTTTLNQTILPGQTWNSPNEVGKILAPGDGLAAVATLASTLTISAGGLVMT